MPIRIRNADATGRDNRGCNDGADLAIIVGSRYHESCQSKMLTKDKMKKQETGMMNREMIINRDALDVFAVICVQAKGQGSCPLNINLIQEITDLPLSAIADAINALIEDGTIHLGLGVPDHDSEAAV